MINKIHIISIALVIVASALKAETTKSFSLFVAQLSNVNCSVMDSDVVSKRFTASLETIASKTFSQCTVISTLPSGAEADMNTLVLKGEYVVREKNGVIEPDGLTSGRECMIVVRLYKNGSDSPVKTVQEHWFPETDLSKKIRLTAVKVISYSKMKYLQENQNRNRREKNSKRIPELELGFAPGYFVPVGEFVKIAEYGVGFDIIAGFSGVKPGFFKTDSIALRLQTGYVFYAPAKETVEYIHTFSVKSGIGYEYGYQNFRFTPYIGPGLQISRMSFDGRDNAVKPYIFKSETYLEPLLYSAIECAYSFSDWKLFLLPAFTLFNDGGVAGMTTAIHIGAGKTFSWSGGAFLQ